MNLIERYGSYDSAKVRQEELSKMAADPHLLYVGKIIKEIGEIEIGLLEYRRQHNIFEVGDKVFYTGRANDNDLYTIKEIYVGHDFVVGDNGADKNFWTLFLEEIRHATDAEIKAGKRLEV